MKKKLMSLILACVVAAGMSLTAFAAGSYDAADVTFNGSELTMHTKQTGAFENMLPGEQRTETIELKNTSSGTAIYYMDAAVLKALEARDAKQTVAANKTTAYTYEMTVQDYDKSGSASGAASTIYSTTAGGTNSAGMSILNEDLNGSENVYSTSGDTATKNTNWVAVAQLAAGESATISFSMKLDGAATQNEYNNLAGQLAFQFRVRNVEAGTTYNTVTRTVYDVRNIVRTVKTGDYTPITVLVTIMVVGFGMMYLLFRKKDKKEQSTETK